MNKDIKDKYKITVVGDSGVGKSAILTRFTENTFNPHFTATIGIQYTNKQQGDNLRLELWDTVFQQIYKAGQESYRSIVRFYFRKCAAILIVYDVTDLKSFKNVDIWARDIAENGDEGVTITLVGNQINRQNERLVLKEVGQQKAKQLNALFFETSAKDSTNINEIFQKTMERVLLNPNVRSLSKSIGLLLQQHQTEEKAKGWCFGFC